MDFSDMCATFAKGAFTSRRQHTLPTTIYSAGHFFHYRDSLRLPQLSA
jgi:hypothetical protein